MSRNHSLRRWTAALAVMALVVASCGDDSEDATTGASSTEASTTGATTATTVAVTTTGGATTTAAAAAATYPVTLTDDRGEVTLAAAPAAIVSLSPSLTETLFAVGAGDQVAAVDSASDYPDGTPMTDLSGFRPNVEAIGGYEPDLVIVSRDRDDLAATLEGIGIPVLVLGTPSDLDGLYAQIETIGEATGHAAEAQQLVTSMRDEIEGLVGAAPERQAPLSYYFELSEDHHSLTSDGLVGSILASLGLVNIADGVDPAAGAFPQLTAEYVIDADPDVVFVAHTDGSVPTPEEVASRPGWEGMTAVQDGQVVVLDPDVASRWGPRVVDLVAVMTGALGDIGGG